MWTRCIVLSNPSYLVTLASFVVRVRLVIRDERSRGRAANWTGFKVDEMSTRGSNDSDTSVFYSHRTESKWDNRLDYYLRNY